MILSDKYKLPNCLKNLPTFLKPKHKPISSLEFLLFCAYKANEVMMYEIQDLLNRLSMFIVAASEFLDRNKPKKHPENTDLSKLTPVELVKTIKSNTKLSKVSLTDPLIVSPSPNKPWSLDSSDKESQNALMEKHYKIQDEREKRQISRLEASEYFNSSEMEKGSINHEVVDTIIDEHPKYDAINPLQGIPLYETIKNNIASQSRMAYGNTRQSTVEGVDGHQASDDMSEDNEMNPKDISKIITTMAQCRLVLCS